MKIARGHKIDGTNEELDELNPVVGKGHIAVETDTNEIRIGNGESTWRNLVMYTGS